MITKQLSKKDLNTILLNIYRKEKNCELIQGNVFYNLTLIKDNYAKLSDRLYNDYITIEKYKDRITALQHLIYGKIYDLYDDAMAAINDYNDAVSQRDYLVERKSTLNGLIHQQEQRRDNELAAYNTLVNTTIPNKQTEIANKQAAVTAKQQQLDTTQAELDRLDNFIEFWETYYNRLKGYRDNVSGSNFNHLNDSDWYYLTYTASQYIANLNMPHSIVEYFDTNNIWPSFPACVPSSNGHYTAKEMYTQNPARIYYKIQEAGVVTFYSLKMGDTQLVFNQYESNATQAGNKLCEYFYSILDPMLSALQTNKPSDASLRALRDQYAAELATLQSELATLQSELATLEADRDHHWNEYQDALKQIQNLQAELSVINIAIDRANENVSRKEEIARQKSTRYNDAVAELPPEKQEEYTPLPAPWGDYVTPEDDDDD